MIDKFDYQEPACPLCDGKDFYYPRKDAPLGTIPIGRIIDKVDALFDKNDYAEAGRLLTYWKDEAISLKDKRGELAMESELIGYYRKQNNPEKGLASIHRALTLAEELGQSELASGATIFINCATAYKAFDMVREALPLFFRAEQIYKKILSPDDERFGGLYNNMALALVDLHKFEEAEAAYHSALSVMEKAPRGEAECAITYINLAHMYEEYNNLKHSSMCAENDISHIHTDETCTIYDKIQKCMKKAYSLLQSENLPRNGYYAFVLEKCAPSFQYFGNTKAYEQMIKEAQKIYART